MLYNLSDFLSSDKTNILIHAGDISNKGGEKDVTDFIQWFQNLGGWDQKIFISGNHDYCFERINKPSYKGIYNWLDYLMSPENLSQSDVTYLEDSSFTIETPEFSRPIKFYGSPWQPWFYDWAFNLPRNGDELKDKWEQIPMDTDILITHGPAYGYVDKVVGQYENLGCELLTERIKEIKPKIHVCGHIHTGYGYTFDGDTHYINASVLNEQYGYSNKPLTVDWNPKTNEIQFI
jgi:predicted phosphodiesterase